MFWISVSIWESACNFYTKHILKWCQIYTSIWGESIPYVNNVVFFGLMNTVHFSISLVFVNSFQQYSVVFHFQVSYRCPPFFWIEEILFYFQFAVFLSRLGVEVCRILFSCMYWDVYVVTLFWSVNIWWLTFFFFLMLNQLYITAKELLKEPLQTEGEYQKETWNIRNK